MAEREIRVLALASKAAGLAPGQRYRFEQWAPHLERHHGISIDLLPFESPRLSEVLYEPGHLVTKAALVSRDFVRRASVMKASRSYDAILIYREASLIGPAIYERLLARTGKPIILDFDDAIWSPAQAHLATRTPSQGLGSVVQNQASPNEKMQAQMRFSAQNGACCHCNSITRPRKPGSLCPIKSPKPSSWRKRNSAR